MTSLGRIPEEIIEEVKRRNDIVSVVEQYVNLTKRSTANFFGLCPFHGEDTPSFSVSPSKQIFYCFGCHKGGDVIRFIMDMEKLSYPEAIRFLAKRVGLEIPVEQESQEAVARRQRRKRLERINLEAARYFYRALQAPAGQKARAYCQARGLSVKLQRQFGLGYAPAEWTGLLTHLRDKRLLDHPEDLKACGLFKLNRQGKPFDLFRDRLIFPVLDPSGTIVAFGGRILAGEGPKYVNSPETPLYIKGQQLYGLHLAKRSQADFILLVEGYLDVIAAHEAGVDSTVGALGTALTLQQVRLLRKQGKTVILCFDADRAGQTAMMRSLALLDQEQVPVRVLVLPQGKDPDEFIRTQGVQAFQNCLTKSLSVLDYRLYRAKQSALDDHGEVDRDRYLEAVMAVLADEPNEALVETRLSEVAQVLRINLHTLMQTYYHRRGQGRLRTAVERTQSDATLARGAQPQQRPAPTQPTQGPVAPLLDLHERRALEYLSVATLHPDWLLKTKHLPPEAAFPTPALKQYYLALLKQAPQPLPYESFEALSQLIPDFPESVHQVLLALVMQPYQEQVKQEALEELLPPLMREYVQSALQQLSQQMSETAQPTPEQIEAMQALLQLQTRYQATY